MSARGELKKIDQVRKTFVGQFARYGKKRGKWNGDTVLLLNIYHADRVGDHGFKVLEPKLLVTDHLWFNLTGGFAALNLMQGDRVLFDARVKEYRKGSVKRDLPVSFDYKLSHPYKVQKVKENNQRE